MMMMLFIIAFSAPSYYYVPMKNAAKGVVCKQDRTLTEQKVCILLCVVSSTKDCVTLLIKSTQVQQTHAKGKGN